MNREARFVKNTIIVGIGKITTQIVSFCLLPLYTNSLNPEQYGNVDLFQTYASIIMVIVYLQIEQALFRFLVDARMQKEQESSIMSTAIIFSFAVDIFLTVFGTIVKNIPGISEYAYIFYMVAALHFFENMLQLARGGGDNVTYTIANFCNSVLLIFFNIVFLLVLHMRSEGMFFSIISSSVCSALYIVFKSKVYRRIHLKHFSFQKLKELAAYSFPLVPNAISWWIIGASDRIILSYFLGSAAIGLVTVSQKFSTAIFNVYCIVNITWNEFVSVNISDPESTKFSEMKEIILSSFSAVCIGCISIVPLLFYFLINHQYNDAYFYIPLYIIGVMLNIVVNMMNAFFVGLKKTSDIAKTSAVAGIINIAINLLLVKYIGIYAAALSTILAYAITAVWRIACLKKYITIKWNYVKIIIIIIQFVITLLLYYLKAAHVFYMINMLIAAAVWLLMNKRYIVNILNIIRRQIKK